MHAIKETQFNFPGQTRFARGKVRDIYFFDDEIVLIATDRISAFDVILPMPIPHKGEILNRIAANFMELTKDIVPNWVISSPDPNVTIGLICKPYPVEMVVRGYLAGHAWREYRDGKRTLCGVPLPEGLKENDKLPEPVITPTTKATSGHDEDISKEEIIAQGIVEREEYELLEKFSLELFTRGTQIAHDRGLILVDTKYEFGKRGDQIYLIDEVHTPDSSRYFYLDSYEERQAEGLPQEQLSKEFVREWLISEGFQGKDGQQMPAFTEEKVMEISRQYIKLFEKVTGRTFEGQDYSDNPLNRIEKNVEKALRL